MPKTSNHQSGSLMNVTQEIIRLLDEVLSLNGRSCAFTRETFAT